MISYFTASKPEKHILLRLLSPVNSKWQRIGDLLGINFDIIRALSTSTTSDHVKMSKILQSWLDNEPTPVTWDNIIKVLDGPLQEKTLVDEIQQFFKPSM